MVRLLWCILKATIIAAAMTKGPRTETSVVLVGATVREFASKSSMPCPRFYEPPLSLSLCETVISGKKVPLAKLL